MRRFYGCCVFLFVIFLFTKVCYAECTGVCSQYCGAGYCTDYIQFRLGVRQPGNAGEWSGGISPSNVQADDVAIFGGNPGHVAVVDSVSGDNITISEWNFGSQLSPPGNVCGVTNEFGVLHSPRRTISKSSVTRFWRPGFSGDSSPLQATMRVVGETGWYPATKTCINADEWARVRYGRVIQSVGSNSICYEEYIRNPTFQSILLGSGSLPQECTQ